jgi:peptidyl-prolyl cis-trans isomerase C
MDPSDRDPRCAGRFRRPWRVAATAPLTPAVLPTAIAVLLWCGAGSPSSPAVAQPSAVSTAVASVGGKPVSVADFTAALRRAGLDREGSSEQQIQARAEVLEKLVDARLLRNEIEGRKIEVAEPEVAAIVEQMRAQLSTNNLTLDEFLARSGNDERSLRGEITLELGLNKLIRPRMTNEAIEAAFLKHRRDIDGTRLRASHILLRPDPGRGEDAIPAAVREANAIRRDILQGHITFANAARKFSVGPSRRQDGDLGFFPRQGVMVDDFARTAFTLAKGDISKPVVTPFGVHLIMVTDVVQGEARLEQLRPQVEKLLAQEFLRELLTRARAETDIVYAPDVPHFDPATPAGDSSPRRIIVSAPPE